MNISQQVVFRDIVRDGSGNITSQDVIPLQRNHLYKVVLTPKYNLGALEFEKIDYAIQVVDWQNGETIKFTGDANLTATSTPNFIVEGAAYNSTEVGYDGIHNPNRVTAGIHDKTFRVIVTSQTTGTMMECPEFDSSKGSYGLVSTSNDADGNLVETYEIHVRENVLINHTTFTFRINNAINTAFSRTFVLRGGINPDELQYGDYIYADGTYSSTYHNDPANPAVGVVVYKNSTPDVVCQAGSINEDNEPIIGKVLVMALKDAYDDKSTPKWSSTNTDHTSTIEISGSTVQLFPNVGQNGTLAAADYYGYEKTLQLAKKTGECAGHSHPVAEYAFNYHENRLTSSVSTDYLIGSTGWFLGTLGQYYSIAKSVAIQNNISVSALTYQTYMMNGVCAKINTLLTTANGYTLTRLSDTWGETWTSTEMDANRVPEIWFKGSASGNGFYWDDEPKTSGDCAIRPILAY